MKKNIESKKIDDSEDYCMAICPHCGGALMPPRRMLGDTIICQDTGREFVIQEHKMTHNETLRS